MSENSGPSNTRCKHDYWPPTLCPECKSELAAPTGSPISDTPETDRLEYEQECNFDVCWEDHSRRLERQRNRIRHALEKVLASAYPHPSENQTMHEAWQYAIKTLSENNQAGAPTK